MSIEQAQAILYGLALGDTLGWPVEFMKLTEIKRRFVPAGITEPPEGGLFTDDTQMTIAVAEGLIEAGSGDLDALMMAIGDHFVSWAHSPENDRAPGRTCMAGVKRFEQGLPWRQSGIASSKGCGSAMRVAPIGYFFQHEPERLREVAAASSLITHGHPAAIAASVGAAYLVKLALDAVPIDKWLSLLSDFAGGQSEDLDQALSRAGHVLGWGDEVAAMRHIGQGWVGEEAVALALYCAMRYPDDYVIAVRRAVNMDGDSDSVGCIVGGVLGGALGLDAIPGEWRARCERSSYLGELGERLADARKEYIARFA